MCKRLDEASGIKGEGWGYINYFNGVKLQKGMSKLGIRVESFGMEKHRLEKSSP